MIVPQERSDYAPTGHQMIRSISIKNYRCFRDLAVSNVARLTVILGDNGTGKTSFLEAIFLALGSALSMPLRFRAQRGLEGRFNAPIRRVEDAIWGDLFYKFDLTQPIQVAIRGDGAESRSVLIVRAPAATHIPHTGSIMVKYKSAEGKERVFFPDISKGVDGLGDTGEDLQDFFYVPATQPFNSVEVAGRFSDLSKTRKQRPFVDVFSQEYDWLQDIDIEMVAGAGALFATIDDLESKVALPNVSGGINRMVGIMTTLASRTKAIALVDEIENGVFYKHQPAIWRGLIKVLRDTDAQLLTTTHSKECLQALIEAAGDKVDDIAVWRIERQPKEKQPVLRQFTGQAIKAALEMGTEPR